jgi:outer membrane protein OmpA-like peptidoglycan-associated protein
VTPLRSTLAISSALVTTLALSSAAAEEAPQMSAGADASTQAAKKNEVAAVGGTVGGQASTTGGVTGTAAGTADAPTAAPTGEWEEKWVPWNTGEAEADMGFSFFGHLGLGHRFNEGPSGEPDAPNGIRIGVTGIFRPIRWFGFGIGYEHADLERTTVDESSTEFRDTYRDLNNLWIDARAYPLRFDPFAMYISVAGGPSWQVVDSSKLTVEPNSSVTTRGDKCSAGASAGAGLKGAIGAELALVSGAILWGDFGPDYYFLSEQDVDGCDVGAGGSFLFGFRAGIAIGFERTRVQKEQPKLPPAPGDQDGDGITDPQDACPTVAGVASTDPKKNGCPPDQDGDGFIDSQDACPTQPGVADPDPKKNGCPPPKDKDADGITDEVDACPEIAGVKTEDPKTNGCPPDTDGDGFRDDQDACPQEKGVDDPDPSKRGCPKLVRVTEKEIVILEQVQFDFAKATIKKESDALLDSVAQVLKEHPEILKVEVQGHTDNKGPAAVNTKLSNDRADAVKKALEKRGIESGRLVHKGYGPDKPIADNKTDEGRAKNRRVQFIVLDKKAKAPEAPPAAAPATPPATP